MRFLRKLHIALLTTFAIGSLIPAPAHAQQLPALPELSSTVALPNIQLPALPTIQLPVLPGLPALPELSSSIPNLPGVPAQANPVRNDQVIRQQVLDSINRYRMQNGLRPWTLDPGLHASAQDWANTMAAQNRMYHTSAPVSEIVLFIHEYNADAMVNTWKTSPPHNSIMLDPNLTRAGVGVSVHPSGRIYASVQALR